jgi:hypothetical protein
MLFKNITRLALLKKHLPIPLNVSVLSNLLPHYRHMALHPKSGPGLPFWGFVTITVLRGWIFSPAPSPQPGGPGLRIYGPRGQGGPAIPPGTGYPF